jgi:hypothetical protein
MTQSRGHGRLEAPRPGSTLWRGILVVVASAAGLAVVGALIRIVVVLNTFASAEELRSRALVEFILLTLFVVLSGIVLLAGYPWLNSWRSWKVLSPILLNAHQGSLASITPRDEKAWGLRGHGRYVMVVDQKVISIFCVDRRT